MSFSTKILQWYDQHGRKDLPWQTPRHPYPVWISEMMLQQTQVKTVLPYFNRFIERFPDVYALAAATEDQVLAYWSGLGYYRRARYLQKTAHMIVQTFEGQFPSRLSQLEQLPGIGPSTAAAIASLAFEQPCAILDGNVKRVLSRYFLVGGDLQQAAMQRRLWQLANECMPSQRCGDYTQAIMDFGATCCTSHAPTCTNCPLQTECLAYQQQVVHDYPPKKPKKTLPTKQQQFLFLQNNSGQFYLEKQPPVGLWGGLWCPPMIDVDVCASDYAKEKLFMVVSNRQTMMNLKHTFSHFHLHITALLLEINETAFHLAEPKGRWFYSHELTDLGLAKPVKQMFASLLT